MVMHKALVVIHRVIHSQVSKIYPESILLLSSKYQSPIPTVSNCSPKVSFFSLKVSHTYPQKLRSPLQIRLSAILKQYKALKTISKRIKIEYIVFLLDENRKMKLPPALTRQNLLRKDSNS